MAEDFRSPAVLPKGSTVSNYLIDSVFTRSIAETVYLANQTNADGQVFLVEYLPESISQRLESGQIVPSGENAAEFQAGLNAFQDDCNSQNQGTFHSVSPILASFKDEKDNYYKVRPLLNGKTLKNILEEKANGKMTEEEVEPWLKQLLTVMAKNFAANLKHHDLSLDNILLGPNATPLILDLRSANAIISKVGNTTDDTNEYLVSEADAYSVTKLVYRVITGAELPDLSSGTVSLEKGFTLPVPYGLSRLQGQLSPGLYNAIHDSLLQRDINRINEFFAPLEKQPTAQEIKTELVAPSLPLQGEQGQGPPQQQWDPSQGQGAPQQQWDQQQPPQQQWDPSQGQWAQQPPQQQWDPSQGQGAPQQQWDQQPPPQQQWDPSQGQWAQQQPPQQQWDPSQGQGAGQQQWAQQPPQQQWDPSQGQGAGQQQWDPSQQQWAQQQQGAQQQPPQQQWDPSQGQQGVQPQQQWDQQQPPQQQWDPSQGQQWGQQQGAAFTQAPTQSQGNVAADGPFYSAYLQPNSESYVKKFSKIQNGQSSFLGFGASLIGLFWLPYRKLILPALITVLLVLIFGFGAHILLGEGYLPYKIILTALISLLIAAAISCFFGVNWVKKKADNAIAKTKALTGGDFYRTKTVLEDNKGYSILLPLIFILLFAGAYLAGDFAGGKIWHNEPILGNFMASLGLGDSSSTDQASLNGTDLFESLGGTQTPIEVPEEVPAAPEEVPTPQVPDNQPSIRPGTIPFFQVQGLGPAPLGNFPDYREDPSNNYEACPSVALALPYSASGNLTIEIGDYLHISLYSTNGATIVEEIDLIGDANFDIDEMYGVPATLTLQARQYFFAEIDSPGYCIKNNAITYMYLNKTWNNPPERINSQLQNLLASITQTQSYIDFNPTSAKVHELANYFFNSEPTNFNIDHLVLAYAVDPHKTAVTIESYSQKLPQLITEVFENNLADLSTVFTPRVLENFKKFLRGSPFDNQYDLAVAGQFGEIYGRLGDTAFERAFTTVNGERITVKYDELTTFDVRNNPNDAGDSYCTVYCIADPSDSNRCEALRVEY
ncbi:MAG: hypothetical protein LBE38_10165 [Deltaproteobacteria bacterium]|jgi:hypothetical protein|nr:hypothetical protein [Deltaproteobacteria bacterium]